MAHGKQPMHCRVLRAAYRMQALAATVARNNRPPHEVAQTLHDLADELASVARDMLGSANTHTSRGKDND